MNQHSPISMQASAAEISASLKVLFDALPFQRGRASDNVAMAYVEALIGSSAESVQAGIRKFLRGECEDVNPRYVPTPPELARIVRSAVVPHRTAQPVETAKRLAVDPVPGERERMRLKMPMWRYAFHAGLVDELDRANRAGFGAMVALATKWGIPIPEELLFDEARTENEWRIAGNRARAEMEANPPPFMRRRRAAA